MTNVDSQFRDFVTRRIISLDLAASMSLVRGLSTVHKFGYNPAVVAVSEDIWDQGGIYTYLAAAATLYVSSSSGSDTAVTIEVEGLDANWAAQTQTVTVTGQTQAAIAGTWMRVFRAFNSSGTAAVGDIYIAETDTLSSGVPTTASKIKAKITQGEEQTLMAIYSVPAGQTAYLRNLNFHVATNLAMTFNLYAREFGGVFRIQAKYASGGDNIPVPLKASPAFPEKTDIVCRALGVAAAAPCSATFDLLLKG